MEEEWGAWYHCWGERRLGSISLLTAEEVKDCMRSIISLLRGEKIGEHIIIISLLRREQTGALFSLYWECYLCCQKFTYWAINIAAVRSPFKDFISISATHYPLFIPYRTYFSVNCDCSTKKPQGICIHSNNFKKKTHTHTYMYIQKL